MCQRGRREGKASRPLDRGAHVPILEEDKLLGCLDIGVRLAEQILLAREDLRLVLGPREENNSAGLIQHHQTLGLAQPIEPTDQCCRKGNAAASTDIAHLYGCGNWLPWVQGIRRSGSAHH
jgi:hypothetical protein